MENPTHLVERYIATFNETDRDRRRELIERLYAADGTYTDPNVDLRGPAEIDGFVAMTQEHFPGYTFALGSSIDAHHDQARFRWHGGPAEEPDRYVGFDVIVTDNGRIRSVYGFMDKVPAA
jgi:SnoaL-like domain